MATIILKDEKGIQEFRDTIEEVYIHNITTSHFNAGNGNMIEINIIKTNSTIEYYWYGFRDYTHTRYRKETFIIITTVEELKTLLLTALGLSTDNLTDFIRGFFMNLSKKPKDVV